MGSLFDDLLRGNDAGNLLKGLAGADKLYGGGGADTLIGAANNDRIRGGADNDLLQGKAGVDRVFGEAGDDTIEGNLGDDTLDRSAHRTAHRGLDRPPIGETAAEMQPRAAHARLHVPLRGTAPRLVKIKDGSSLVPFVKG